jgi:zinc/manganese transport system permease protein
VAIALICTLGGILLSLVTNAPVSVFVTSLSFAGYLLARFVIGPRRRERRLIASRAEARAGATPTVSKTG